MPLNPLTLNVNSGIVGRPFSATVSGLSAGSTLEVGIDGTPGFSTVNGRVTHQSLPYAVNTLVLRETLAGDGVRESRIDILADGVALGASGLPAALSGLGVAPLMEKLRRAAAYGAATNPHDAPLSLATATTTAAADAALTRVYAGAQMLSGVRVTGGRTVPYGSAYVFRVADNVNASGNLAGLLPSTPTYNSWISEVEFQVDTATKVQARLTANTTFFYRVLVDGRYISKTPVAYTASGENILTIDLSPLPQGPHIIKIEVDTNQQFISISLPPTASISRPTISQDRVIALCTGDSYSEGQGSSYKQMGAWVKTLGRRMGWTDVRQVALGGTGYMQAGGRVVLAEQMAYWPVVNDDILMSQVDVVTIASGYNDPDPGTNPTAAAYISAYNAALLTFQRTRAMCPNARIYVFGPWNGTRGTNSSQSTNVENVVKAAFAAWGDRNAAFIPVTTATPQSWFTGTGRVGTTNGTGNTDFLVSTDAVHPIDMGHDFIARQGESAIRADLVA